MDLWTTFDLAVARWVLGERLAEDMPAAAIDAMTAGADSPTLPLLAAMEGAGWSEVRPVIDQVLGERNRSRPTSDEALKLVCDDVITRIADGDLEPEDGVQRLYRLSMGGLDAPFWPDLGVFHHLALDWEVAETGAFSADEVKADILRAATETAARGGLRES